MLYYRSKHPPRNLRVPTVRLIAAGALLAYPVGALMLRFGETLVTSLAGFGLITFALVALVVLMTCSIQRIVAEDPALLDEYELRLRARAVSSAFTALSALFLIATIYLAIAADLGAWVPSTYEDFNGAFWGIFLWATLLPTLCLSFQLDPADDQGEA